jgi:predicted transcriptional regulator
VNLTTFTHADIAAILNRNYGSKVRLAKKAKVTSAAVSMYLRMGNSANIHSKAQALCRTLLEKEERAKTA